MRAWGVGVVALAGCGRIAFDELADGHAIDADAVDYCARIPPLASAPVIDGVLEPGLVLQPVVPVGWLGSVQTNAPPPMPDIAARFAIGWRPDGVYFFVDVTDPDRFPATRLPYCGDGVELYVDSDGQYPAAPSFDATGVRQLIARAPMDDITPRADGAIWVTAMMMSGAWVGGFSAYPRPGGYVFEALIDGGALGLASWSLASGARVGIDLSINVSTSDGSVVPIADCDPNYRLGQFFLRIDESYALVVEGAPFAVPTAYCTATLE